MQLTTETLAKGMQWLNGSYAIAFNRRHGRVGHLLQGRYKSPAVDKEQYLLRLIRYIVLNPVTAELVKKAEDDRWTSYRATIGLAPAPEWLAVDDVLLPFNPDRDLARAALRDFVNAGIEIESSEWSELVGRSYIGSDEWLATIDERIKLKPRSIEHPFEQRVAHRRSMRDIVGVVAETFGMDQAHIRCGLQKTARMVAAWTAWKGCLLTGSEIGAELKLTNARVSQLVRICDRELARDANLRDAVSTIGRKLKI